MDKQEKKIKRPRKLRLLIQCGFAALCNGHIQGFFRGKIYTGPLKTLCVPGMNCYSCPGALGSCPIGSLQAVLGSREYQAALYVFGLLTVLGTLMGRLVCGLLCPFGLIQDLLHKIPFIKKLRRLPGERFLRLLRFVFLGVFVILLPMVAVDAFGIGDPWFCKYVCPVGTLEAGIPLVLLNKALQSALGFLYTWKLVILALTVVLSIILFRPFCRYICPLGAVYGLFNRFALYRYHIDPDSCIECGACQRACGMDIEVWKNPNSIDCVRCGACRDACPTGAIRTSWQKKDKSTRKISPQS